ncbi:MAG TPA: hypothetical protein VFS43_25600 [Polyangiaceae bacterium]|nr:hypothetical protein [Polyangiaceae bacterium]
MGRLLSAVEDTLAIVSYALLDREGQNILDTILPWTGKDESSSEYFRGAIDGLPYVSSVLFADRGPTLVFSSPIRDPRDKKKTIGVLRCIYDLSVVQHLILLKNGLAGPESFASTAGA